MLRELLGSDCMRKELGVLEVDCGLALLERAREGLEWY